MKRTTMAVLTATALAAVSAGLLPAVTARAQAGDQGRPQARARAGYEPVLDPADFVPVVQAIAAAHGGRAWAENRPEGGARVSMTARDGLSQETGRPG